MLQLTLIADSVTATLHRQIPGFSYGEDVSNPDIVDNGIVLVEEFLAIFEVPAGN